MLEEIFMIHWINHLDKYHMLISHVLRYLCKPYTKLFLAKSSIMAFSSKDSGPYI